MIRLEWPLLVIDSNLAVKRSLRLVQKLVRIRGLPLSGVNASLCHPRWLRPG
jgi:hypothetical protein